jgi:sugar phosphate isomerase/epimerase
LLLGYNTNGLVHHRLDEALELLAAEGFEAVALTPDVGQLDPYRTEPSEVARIAGLLRRHRLTCVIETGARFLLDPRRKHRPNLLEARREDRARRLDFLGRCLRLAADLEAPTLSFWAGQRPAEVDAGQARAHLLAGIESLLREAERLGVGLALEAEPGMLVETVAEALSVRTDLGAPAALGLTVDVGHIYVTGEGGVADVLQSAAPCLRQVHIEDMRRGVHEHLPPGQGEVDFPLVWASLERAGYRGPVCFELSRSSHAAPDMLRLARRTFETGRVPPAR